MSTLTPAVPTRPILYGRSTAELRTVLMNGPANAPTRPQSYKAG